MSVDSFYKKNMRNHEHFMYHTEVRDLIMRTGAENLKISALFAKYMQLYYKLSEGLSKVNKSVHTAKIKEEDKKRDFLYSGMVKLAVAMLKNPNEARQDAAKRLNIVFKTYGNISKKALNDQTSAVTNILQELKGPYAKDARLLGLTDYIQLLEASNKAFGAIVRERYDEVAARSSVVVKTARQELDEVYGEMIEAINALAILGGGEVCKSFIVMLNTIIAKYVAALRTRLGKRRRPNPTHPL